MHCSECKIDEKIRDFGRLTGRWCKGGSASIFFLLAGLAGVSASDYSDTCRSGDNSYVMMDGELYDNNTYESQPEEAEPIPVVTLGSQVLRLRQGYCLSDQDQPKRGHRYGYETKTYLLRVQISSEDQAQEVELICEKVADGLPANRDCDEDVITKDVVMPIPFTK